MISKNYNNFGIFIRVTILFLFIISIVGCTRLDKPNAQLRFEQVVTQHRRDFNSASTDLQRSNLRASRQRAIQQLDFTTADNWAGTIVSIGTNRAGKAHVTIELCKNVFVGTYNNALSDIGSNTLIDNNTDMFRTLSTLNIGDKVRFSGTFFVRSANPDHFSEMSLTLRGTMRTPTFLMRFTNISRY